MAARKRRAPLSVSLGMGGGRGTGNIPPRRHITSCRRQEEEPGKRRRNQPSQKPRGHTPKKEGKFRAVLQKQKKDLGGSVGMCQILTRANPWGQGDTRSDDRLRENRGSISLASGGARPYQNSAPRRCSSTKPPTANHQKRYLFVDTEHTAGLKRTRTSKKRSFEHKRKTETDPSKGERRGATE
uniref:Uncharacterized protein n=1 Tax=Arundo donax TaxID=35708 RepID=A0A0A8XRH9_ARUDO